MNRIGHNRPPARPAHYRAWSAAEFQAAGWRGNMRASIRGTTSGHFDKESEDGLIHVAVSWTFSSPSYVSLDIVAPGISVRWRPLKCRTLAARIGQAILDDHAAAGRMTRERVRQLVGCECRVPVQ